MNIIQFYKKYIIINLRKVFLNFVNIIYIIYNVFHKKSVISKYNFINYR